MLKRVLALGILLLLLSPLVTWAQGDTRPGHVFLEGGGQADYLYRSFIQIPVGIAWGPDDNLYLADWTGRHIVRLHPEDGSLDDLGLWRDAGLWQNDGPRDLAFDSAGNLYANNHGQIYVISTDGEVREIRRVQGSPVGGIEIGPDDVLYYSDRGEGRVLRIGSDGRSEVVASGIENADNMAFGPDGTLYVSQMSRNRVVQVDVETGEVSEFFAASFRNDPIYLAVDADGDVWLRGLNVLYQVAPDGTEIPFEVEGRTYSGDVDPLNIRTAGGIAFDDQGRLWIAAYNSLVWRLDPPGMATTYIVSGGGGVNARSCPALNCDIVAVLPPGQALTVIETVEGDTVSGSAEWHHATYEGAEIYVHTSLVAAQGAAGMTLTLVVPGLEASDLEVGAEGEVYAYNENARELWRISPQGEVEVLLTLEFAGRVGLALGDEGTLYLGLPSGQISRLEADGTLTLYAPLLSRRMVVGEDGNLYAVVGDYGQPKSLVRITGPNAYTTFVTQIEGEALGGGEVHVAAAPDGLYLFDEQRRRLYFVDFDGQGRVVADVPAATGGPAAMTAAPDGTLFVVPHGPYRLDRFDADGSSAPYAYGVFGDPWGMAASPDGQWLYVAESGAIDRIPIR